MTAQPTFFLPHGGGPCFFMDWTWGPADTWHPLAAFLQNLPATLPEKPKAILLISGHWEEPTFTVNAGAKPALLFDYYGFPAHTYELKYPAPGDPSLAQSIVEHISAGGLSVTTVDDRGFDHGVFVPLKVVFPEANIPIVQLSLDRSLDPEIHLVLGRALAPLRKKGVLIVGSGMSWHNLRLYGSPETLPLSKAFDEWLTNTVEQPSAEKRNQLLAKWLTAPSARTAHPREEHLIPLMVAAGAAGEDPGECVFRDTPLDAVISAYRFG